MQPLRGTSEVALLDDGDEVQKLTKGDSARLAIAAGYAKNAN